MDGIAVKRIHCPYCGEPNELLVDTSIEEQAYVEDCEVCCRPMMVSARMEADGPIVVEVRREED